MHLPFLFLCFFVSCLVAEREIKDLDGPKEDGYQSGPPYEHRECRFYPPAPGDQCFTDHQRVLQCIHDRVDHPPIENGLGYHCSGTNKWYSIQWEEPFSPKDCVQLTEECIRNQLLGGKRSTRASYSRSWVFVSPLPLPLFFSFSFCSAPRLLLLFLRSRGCDNVFSLTIHGYVEGPLLSGTVRVLPARSWEQGVYG